MTAAALLGPRVSRRVLAQWATWLALVIVATIGMLFVRALLDKAHVTLVFLLVVLGASAAGGRALGLTVASLAFLSFDFFFLPPYATLTITNPLDWLALVAFFLTSAVATQLLHRANATAEAATARAREIDRLAALGAETLNAADAEEALRAIAGVIRNSIDVEECDIYLRRAGGGIDLVASAQRGPRGDDGSWATGEGRSARRSDEVDHLSRADGLVGWIIQHGTSAAELEDGTIRLPQEVFAVQTAGEFHAYGQPDIAGALQLLTGRDHDSVSARTRRAFHVGEAPARQLPDEPSVRAFGLPLRVRDHVVGALRIATNARLVLTAEQARLLAALAYYAALGAERARLVANAERAEAERRVEALRSALLTAVSHDLRTPLTTIKGIASEIARGADPGRASIIESEVDRLDALVGDLLDLSRIHAGAVRPTPVVNTIDDLVGSALQASAGSTRGRRVHVDLPPRTLLVGVFDFANTLRVLINLIDNAAKYSPAGTPIDIVARQTGDRLMLDVLDRGPGVPESEIGRIFEPFYRPPGVPPDVRGHGLGLSIARGLAEAQGGSLRFSPRFGGGAIFSLELPAAEAENPDASGVLDLA